MMSALVSYKAFPYAVFIYRYGYIAYESFNVSKFVYNFFKSFRSKKPADNEVELHSISN
jgi:hypothetical protein